MNFSDSQRVSILYLKNSFKHGCLCRGLSSQRFSHWDTKFQKPQLVSPSHPLANGVSFHHHRKDLWLTRRWSSFQFQPSSIHLLTFSIGMGRPASNSQVSHFVLNMQEHHRSGSVNSLLCFFFPLNAKSITEEVWWKDGLHCSPHHIHGQRLRQHFKAMEQAPHRLHVERSTSTGDDRARIHHSVRIGFASCISNGSHARNQRLHRVSLI